MEEVRVEPANQGEKTDIVSLTREELAEQIAQMGEKSFRTGQIYDWLHRRNVTSFDEMTSLSRNFRERLNQIYRIPGLRQAACQVSSLDGTRKYAFALDDGQVIESVLMRYRYGLSACISSQAGCRMGCRFCASTVDGLARNLLPSEMLGQIWRMQQDIGERISHVVIMGSGEPLDNYDNLVRFIRLASDENVSGISQRNITVSTCGLVPQIDRLADEKLAVTLVLSLHAPNDAIRRTMMPVANRYSIQECISACDRYFQKTGRRISYEYSLVHGVNDSLAQADELARLLHGRNCHVNLIPVNPVRERKYREPNQGDVLAFKKRLEKHGINATIRRRMGADIDSACGQLRRRIVRQDVQKGGSI